MKIVFFGTPDYVVEVVNALHKTFKTDSTDSSIQAVVTQQPKPTGRKQKVQYSPVDNWAHKKNIPVFFDPLDIVNNKIKADLGVLASYGKIVPKEVISFFPHGILNIHPSLLPMYRGASPVQAAIAAGDNITGSTIMKLDEKLDHGHIVSQFKEEIRKDDTTETLRARLFEHSSEELTGLIPAYIKGKVKLKEQDHDKVTFTKQINKIDAFIEPEAIRLALEGKSIKKEWDIKFIKDFSIHYSPSTIHQFIRAMQPWPTAWTHVNYGPTNQKIKRLLIHKAHLDDEKLVLDEVQLEGKSPVSWKQFKEGNPQANL